MRLLKYLTALAAVLTQLIPMGLAQTTQPWSWVQTMGGPDNDGYFRVGLTAAGTLLTGGLFADTAYVNGTPLVSTSNPAGFNGVWQQHSATGQSLGVHTLGCYIESYISAVATDRIGNQYVAGRYNSSLTLSSTLTLTNYGGWDAYLAKYDASGTLIWVRTIHSSGNEEIEGLAADTLGNCYATGSYCLTAQFDSTAVAGYYPPNQSGPSGATPDGFLAKYSPNGQVQWVRTTIGPEGEAGLRVSVAPNGDCLVAGLARANTVGEPGVNYAGAKMYLARYSPTGVARWVRPLGAVGQSLTIWGLAATAEGGYFAGYFGGVNSYQKLSLRPGDTLQIGGTFGAANSLVARFDTSGTVEWAQTLHSISWVRATGLALIPGGVAIAGTFRANNFSPQPAFLTAPGYSFAPRGESDGFVATYDSLGGLRSLRVISGTARDDVRNCCYNPVTNELVVVGFFRDTLDWRNDPRPIVSAGMDDGFLMGIPLPRITGLPEAADAAPALAVWPVPAHDVLHVDAPGAAGATIQLHDVLGRLVRQAPARAGQLSVGGLAPGVYQVSLTLPGRAPASRLILVE